MNPPYDAVVGGGSISGLGFAAEASRKGLSVLVAEEHESLGEPEKCDGLVSLRGLRELGFLPREEVVQSRVKSAVIHSPGGTAVSIDASSLEVVVLDRSAYDRQVAEAARAAGAEIRTGARVTSFADRGTHVRVEAGGDHLVAGYYVDATGPASSPKRGIVPAAKYEVEADWITEGRVEVFLDSMRYPGFFAWIIPYGHRLAKVGVAGRRVDVKKSIETFLARGPHKVRRKVIAPIYVGGPADDFVSGRRLIIGEAAGMVKPTTAGGIVTSLAGGTIAAHWLSESVKLGDTSLLSGYRREWDRRFGKEMNTMVKLRRLFEELSNSQLDTLVGALASPGVAAKLSGSDFDFHATALLRALGVRGVLQLARIGVSAEARSLLSG
jgi:geranylgeranyl reductase family protein